MTISDSVNEIGKGAFQGCGAIKSIIVSKNNKAFDSRDNCNAIIGTKDNTKDNIISKLIISHFLHLVNNSNKRIEFDDKFKDILKRQKLKIETPKIQ